jgi:hypothetical protein
VNSPATKFWRTQRPKLTEPQTRERRHREQRSVVLRLSRAGERTDVRWRQHIEVAAPRLRLTTNSCGRIHRQPVDVVVTEPHEHRPQLRQNPVHRSRREATRQKRLPVPVDIAARDLVETLLAEDGNEVRVDTLAVAVNGRAFPPTVVLDVVQPPLRGDCESRHRRLLSDRLRLLLRVNDISDCKRTDQVCGLWKASRVTPDDFADLVFLYSEFAAHD